MPNHNGTLQAVDAPFTALEIWCESSIHSVRYNVDAEEGSPGE